jgi:hypothetical protein
VIGIEEVSRGWLGMEMIVGREVPLELGTRIAHSGGGTSGSKICRNHTSQPTDSMSSCPPADLPFPFRTEEAPPAPALSSSLIFRLLW